MKLGWIPEPHSPTDTERFYISFLYLVVEGICIFVLWNCVVGSIDMVRDDMADIEAAPEGQKCKVCFNSGWALTLKIIIAIIAIIVVGWGVAIFNVYLIEQKILPPGPEKQGSIFNGVAYVLLEVLVFGVIAIVGIIIKGCITETIERVSKTNAKYDIYDQDAEQAEE
jgi:hypothetical protein